MDACRPGNLGVRRATAPVAPSGSHAWPLSPPTCRWMASAPMAPTRMVGAELEHCPGSGGQCISAPGLATHVPSAPPTAPQTTTPTATGPAACSTTLQCRASSEQRWQYSKAVTGAACADALPPHAKCMLWHENPTLPLCRYVNSTQNDDHCIPTVSTGDYWVTCIGTLCCTIDACSPRRRPTERGTARPTAVCTLHRCSAQATWPS